MSLNINGADFSTAISICMQSGMIDEFGPLVRVSKQVNQVVGQLREHILQGLQQIPEIRMICEFSDKFRESRTVKQKLNLIQKIFQGEEFVPTDQLPKFEEMARGRMDNLLLFATTLDKGLFRAITGGEALDRVSTDCVARCARMAVYTNDSSIALELIQRRDFDLSSVITEVENAKDLEAILELAHQLGRTYSTAYDPFADSPTAIMSRHETPPGLQAVLNNAIYRCRHPKFMEVLLRYANPSLEILLHARDWTRLGQVCMAARAQFPGHDFRSSNMLLHREDGRDGERERIYRAVPDRFRYGQYDIRGFASDPDDRRAAFIGMLNRAIDRCSKTRSEAALIKPMSEDLREALREVPAPPRVENSFARLLGLGSEEERTCFLAFLVFTLFFALNAYVVLQR